MSQIQLPANPDRWVTLEVEGVPRPVVLLLARYATAWAALIGRGSKKPWRYPLRAMQSLLRRFEAGQDARRGAYAEMARWGRPWMRDGPVRVWGYPLVDPDPAKATQPQAQPSVPQIAALLVTGSVRTIWGRTIDLRPQVSEDGRAVSDELLRLLLGHTLGCADRCAICAGATADPASILRTTSVPTVALIAAYELLVGQHVLPELTPALLDQGRLGYLGGAHPVKSWTTLLSDEVIAHYAEHLDEATLIHDHGVDLAGRQYDAAGRPIPLDALDPAWPVALTRAFAQAFVAAHGEAAWLERYEVPLDWWDLQHPPTRTIWYEDEYEL